MVNCLHYNYYYYYFLSSSVLNEFLIFIFVKFNKRHFHIILLCELFIINLKGVIKNKNIIFFNK